MREYLEKGEHSEGHAYTSVMSLMDVMHRKGLATRKVEKRAFRYTAALTPGELRTLVLSHVLDAVFGGSTEDLEATLAELKTRPRRKK